MGVYREKEAVRLWNRLVAVPESRLTKKVLRWNLNQGRQNWSSKMERIFDKLEMRDCFENLEICGIGDLLERFRDNYNKTWLEKVKDKVKFRPYKLLK